MARPRCSPATLRRLRGLGRPIPVQCPQGERIEVKTYTRCRPPKRGQKRDRSEPLLEHARNQPEPEAAPRKPAKKPRKLSEREESKNLERTQNIQSAQAALRRLVRDVDHIPTERDIHPQSFMADPCTGEQYEDWKGNYPISHASYAKKFAWSEKIATCARKAWCEEKGPCDDDEVDTSFNPAEFMDGLGRRRRKKKPKRKPAKKRATRRRR